MNAPGPGSEQVQPAAEAPAHVPARLRAVWVLLRQADPPPDGQSEAVVDRVLASEQLVHARVAELMAANTRYPWRQLGPLRWVTGPEDDEGFFGNRTVTVWAVEALLELRGK